MIPLIKYKSEPQFPLFYDKEKSQQPVNPSIRFSRCTDLICLARRWLVLMNVQHMD